MTDKVLKALTIAVQNAESLQVKAGVFAESHYPDGTPVAHIAAIQEFGTVINVPEHTKSLYFRQSKNGEVSPRFVKKSESNFMQKATVKAHTIVIPPRPTFRPAINDHEKEWQNTVVNGLKKGDSTRGVLLRVGEQIKGDIVGNIYAIQEPPLAPRTIAARRKRGKTSTKPLIDTARLVKSISFEVSEIEHKST